MSPKNADVLVFSAMLIKRTDFKVRLIILHIYIYIYIYRCATSRKVADSIPSGVNGIFH